VKKQLRLHFVMMVSINIWCQEPYMTCSAKALERPGFNGL
jgi:hypothetical protein